MSTYEICLTLIGAFAAGLVDAIAGGGGLIQLPVLLLAFPAAPFALLAGTNKFASVFGTLAALLRYNKALPIVDKPLVAGAGAAFIGSMGGACLVTWLPVHVIKPIVVVALIVVWVRSFAMNADQTPQRRFGNIGLVLFAGAIGFYDGLIGPGTGSFLLFGLVHYFGSQFLLASGQAKLVNVATNLAALGVFAWTSSIVYPLAIAMAGLNVVGSLVGAQLAVTRGAPFVKRVFLVVVPLLVGRLLWDIVQ